MVAFIWGVPPRRSVARASRGALDRGSLATASPRRQPHAGSAASGCPRPFIRRDCSGRGARQSSGRAFQSHRKAHHGPAPSLGCLGCTSAAFSTHQPRRGPKPSRSGTLPMFERVARCEHERQAGSPELLTRWRPVRFRALHSVALVSWFRSDATMTSHTQRPRVGRVPDPSSPSRDSLADVEIDSEQHEGPEENGEHRRGDALEAVRVGEVVMRVRDEPAHHDVRKENDPAVDDPPQRCDHKESAKRSALN
jgi:hypothetical protein